MSADPIERAAEALEKAADALVRVAVANERLNDLATEERSYEPGAEELFDAPACPHCGTLDPMTQIKGGDGRLSSFVLATPCGSCGQPFYALPVGWRIVGNKEDAAQMLASKDGLLKGGTEQ